MTKHLLFIALFVVLPVAQAQVREIAPYTEELAQQTAGAEAHHAYMARLSESLAKTGNARDLAFAAILRNFATSAAETAPGGDMSSRRFQRDVQVDAWLQAAAANAGDDAIANQLIIAAVDHDPTLPTYAGAVARWRASDPGNLTPLLQAGVPVDTLLVEGRRATHADAGMYDAVRWMMSAYLRYPPTPEEQAMLGGDEPYAAEEAAALSAMGLWTATAMPGYQRLLQACRGQALRATPTRAADCSHVGGLLVERSGSAIDVGVGLALLRGLASDDDGRAQIDARIRRRDWQLIEWGRVATQQPDAGAAQFVRLLADASIHTEQQMIERVLQEAGVPLEPPAGWTPPRR